MQVIRLDHMPPNLNEYRNMHYFRLNSEKRAWAAIVQNAVREQNIQPVRGRIRLIYTFWFATKARHDPDNYAACSKFIADGLVHAGVLIDDDFKHIGEMTVREGGFSKPPYILVTLEDWDGGEQVG